jgi:hypothetical protein
MKLLMGKVYGSHSGVRLRIAAIENVKPEGEEMRCWRLKQLARVEHLIAPASLDYLYQY